MKQPLFIYGAGGLGREILSLVRNADAWEPAGFIDDVVPRHEIIKGLQIIGGLEALEAIDGPRNVVLAVGNPLLKQKLVQALRPYNIQYPVLIHPTAILQDPESIRIGEGSIIAAGSVLTTDIHIGSHVLVNLNSTIGHDAAIGDYTSIMCGVNIAGAVTIGDSVMVGSGACILNRISVGNKSRVGMGAVVVKPVAPDTTVVGVPAKKTGE